MRIRRICLGLAIVALAGAPSAHAKDADDGFHNSFDGQVRATSNTGSPKHALKVFAASEGERPRSGQDSKAGVDHPPNR